MRTNQSTPTQPGFVFVIVILLVSLFTACANSPAQTSGTSSDSQDKSKSELDRPTALSLAKGKINSPVTRWIYQNERHKLEQYTKLIADKVISCQKRYPIVGNTDVYEYVNCQPAANGKGLVTQGNQLVLVVGYKTPSAVTGISKVNQNAATADMVLSFEPGDGYNLVEKYPDLFGMHPDHFKAEQKRVSFRLYDDGWRVTD